MGWRGGEGRRDERGGKERWKWHGRKDGRERWLGRMDEGGEGRKSEEERERKVGRAERTKVKRDALLIFFSSRVLVLFFFSRVVQTCYCCCYLWCSALTRVMAVWMIGNTLSHPSVRSEAVANKQLGYVHTAVIFLSSLLSFSLVVVVVMWRLRCVHPGSNFIISNSSE